MAEQIAERFEESSGSWITLSHTLAFPVGLLTKPLSDTVTRKLGHAAVVEKTLSPEEMRARLWAFGTFRTALNSVVVALCIIGVWAFIKKSVLRTEHANAADR